MPGTPATSTRFGAPRYANTDASDFAGQVNAVTDMLDSKAGLFLSGLASARPAAGVVDRYYLATDTGELSRDSGAAWTTINPRSRALVTSLPGAPYDGQEILFLADATNRIIWPLRYNAAGGTYKWETLGQATPLYAEVSAFQSLNNTTFTDLTTFGPSLTVPLAGDYDIEVSAQIAPPATAQAYGSIAPAIGAAAAATADETIWQTPAAGLSGANVSQPYRKTGIAVAAAVTMKYRSSGNTSFGQRKLRVRPVRVG